MTAFAIIALLLFKINKYSHVKKAKPLNVLHFRAINKRPNCFKIRYISGSYIIELFKVHCSFRFYSFLPLFFFIFFFVHIILRYHLPKNFCRELHVKSDFLKRTFYLSLRTPKTIKHAFYAWTTTPKFSTPK